MSTTHNTGARPAPRMGACAQRPRRRADCKDGPRPCPWVSCRHHLALDVAVNGDLLVNSRRRTVRACPRARARARRVPLAIVADHVLHALDHMADTCSLDVADRRAHSRAQTARILGISNERCRQLEESGTDTIRRDLREAGITAEVLRD